MEKQPVARLSKCFWGTYGVVFLGLSYFALYPAWKNAGWSLLIVTIYQMLLLAAIVTPYALCVIFLGEDEEHDDGAREGRKAETLVSSLS